MKRNKELFNLLHDLHATVDDRSTKRQNVNSGLMIIGYLQMLQIYLLQLLLDSSAVPVFCKSKTSAERISVFI